MGTDFQKYNLLVILGPTASGKTRVGVEIARTLDGEIISADSRQVYRGMDIGTGKDLKEYGPVPYHLIDILDPGVEFSVFEFQRRFSEAFFNIHGRGKLPILVGGTGLYLDAILRRYRMVKVPANPGLRKGLAQLPIEDLTARLKAVNPRLHNTTDLLDRERVIRAIEIAEFKGGPRSALPGPELEAAVFGIRWPREVLHQRIVRRLRERIEQGMVEEVKKLHQSGVSLERLDSFGLEYRYAAMYLKGQINKNDMFLKLNSAIRQFAKRQETWFRRMERQGVRIRWVEGGQDPAAAILERLKDERLLVDS
jgi:tRNA dimethylallyltransferase